MNRSFRFRQGSMGAMHRRRCDGCPTVRAGQVAYTAGLILFSLLTTSCFPMGGATKSDIERAQILIDQGVVELRRGDFIKARASFLVAEELSPSAAAIDGQGCAAFLTQDFVLAEHFFKRALDFDIRYTAAQGNLALLYEVTGRSDDAERLYHAAIAADPGNFRIRNNYGIFLLNRRNGGDYRARDELQKAAALTDEVLIGQNLLELSRRER